MESVHYKNAGKSTDFMGANRHVRLSSSALGMTMMRLLIHQVQWASPMLTSIVEEENVGALFVCPDNGLPFKVLKKGGQAKCNIGTTPFNSYVKRILGELKMIAHSKEACEREDPEATAEEWLDVDMGPRELRFAYVGWWLHKNNGQTSDWVDRMKKALSRFMLTTPDAWDRHYRKGRDANADMEWAMQQQ
jgi:hypothetical protein